MVSIRRMKIFCICCLSLFGKEGTSSFFENTDYELLKEIYGVDQDHYSITSDQIIESIVSKMSEVKHKGDTASFLSNILPWLGKERGKLAKDLRSKDAHLFGALRESSLYRDLTFLTPLSGPFYEKAGKTLIHSIEKGLYENGLDFSGQGLFPFQRTQFDGIQSVDLWFYRPKDLLMIVKELQDRFESNDPFHKSFFLGGEEERALFQYLSENENAHVIAGADFLKTTASFETTENTLYLLVASTIELEEKRIPLSKVLLQMEVDQLTGNLIKIFPPLILHQETRYTRAMIREMDQIVENILLSTGENRINQIGYFRYLFAHAIPFSRGSAAVGEWLETAFYRFFGDIEFRQNSNTTIDLEVFSSLTFEEFIMRYKALVIKRNSW